MLVQVLDRWTHRPERWWGIMAANVEAALAIYRRRFKVDPPWIYRFGTTYLMGLPGDLDPKGRHDDKSS